MREANDTIGIFKISRKLTKNSPKTINFRQITVNKTHHRKHRKITTEQHNPMAPKIKGERLCSRSIGRSCSACGTFRLAHVSSSPFINLIWKVTFEEDRVVITAAGTYTVNQLVVAHELITFRFKEISPFNIF